VKKEMYICKKFLLLILTISLIATSVFANCSEMEGFTQSCNKKLTLKICQSKRKKIIKKLCIIIPLSFGILIRTKEILLVGIGVIVGYTAFLNFSLAEAS
jgi:hypothetical protein